MTVSAAISSWLQRRVFEQKYMGRHRTESMTFCARVWIEDMPRTEAFLDFFTGKGHCLKAWHNWVKQEMH